MIFLRAVKDTYFIKNMENKNNNGINKKNLEDVLSERKGVIRSD